MIIKSQAGDFTIDVQHFEVEGRDLVLVGKMGVWDARLYMKPREVVSFGWKLLSRLQTLFYIVRLPLLVLRRS